jgi:hypothetical protein
MKYEIEILCSIWRSCVPEIEVFDVMVGLRDCTSMYMIELQSHQAPSMYIGIELKTSTLSPYLKYAYLGALLSLA